MRGFPKPEIGKEHSEDNSLLRSSSVHDPHWAFSASPLPGHGVFPQFSSTSSALFKMKPVCARGSRNTLSAEKLEGCVVSRQNQTRSQCIRVMWFPPFISGGRSCFMEFGTSSGVPQVLYLLSQRKQVLASTHVYTHPE